MLSTRLSTSGSGKSQQGIKSAARGFCKPAICAPAFQQQSTAHSSTHVIARPPPPFPPRLISEADFILQALSLVLFMLLYFSSGSYFSGLKSVLTGLQA